MMRASQRFVVAQLGARMHYAIPNVLAGAALLDRLYTDLYAGAAFDWIGDGIPLRGVLSRLRGRRSAGIPSGRVTAFAAFGIQYAIRLRCARTDADRSRTFLWAGKRFCQLVRSRGFGTAGAIYAYNDAALEILIAARKAGLRCVLEQTIAPLAVESELLAAARDEFPDWEVADREGAILEARDQRQRAEWEAADMIVCGSEFVVDGIRQSNGPWSRCVVVPYGVHSLSTPRIRRFSHRPLRVLTVGAVGLRKGAPAVLQTARAMGATAAQFRMVGPVQVSSVARTELEAALELAGPVPRGEMARHYAWADVFLLPSLCEGSATATYEALAAGLPVVCTPNTGSVVRDSVNGFLVPAGDHRAIVSRLERFIQPGVLEEMSASAIGAAGDVALEAYGRRILSVLTQAPSGSSSSLKLSSQRSAQ